MNFNCITKESLASWKDEKIKEINKEKSAINEIYFEKRKELLKREFLNFLESKNTKKKILSIKSEISEFIYLEEIAELTKIEEKNLIKIGEDFLVKKVKNQISQPLIKEKVSDSSKIPFGEADRASCIEGSSLVNSKNSKKIKHNPEFNSKTPNEEFSPLSSHKEKLDHYMMNKKF